MIMHIAIIFMYSVFLVRTFDMIAIVVIVAVTIEHVKRRSWSFTYSWQLSYVHSSKLNVNATMRIVTRIM